MIVAKSQSVCLLLISIPQKAVSPTCVMRVSERVALYVFPLRVFTSTRRLSSLRVIPLNGSVCVFIVLVWCLFFGFVRN